MQFAEYRDTVVNKLKSGQIYTGMVPSGVTRELLMQSVISSKLVDDAKKALFYGKPSADLGDLIEALDPEDDEYEGVNMDFLHSVMGIVTEAGEIAELATYDTVPRDKLLDEMGDLLWYLTLMATVYGVTLEDLMARNAAKLKARYGDKFSQEKAINRDVHNEDIATRAM